jgi:kynurenine 3-monooxygenase
MAVGDGKTVTIVGAGLAGSLLACYLAKMGFAVTVYERRPDPRAAGYAGGRSINLALSARGLWGLQGVGLDQEILKHAIKMRGRMIHPQTLPESGGELAFQPYSHDPSEGINSISRGGLNVALLDAAERMENVKLVFSHRCTDIDPDRCVAFFEDESSDPARSVSVPSDLIVGADGAFSPVRGRLQKVDRCEYSQTYLTHGYKELHIPALGGPGGLPASARDAGRAPGAGGPAVPPSASAGRWNGYALDPNALHIWPRGSAMMIALPNPDKSFTCTLFWPFEGAHSFANLHTPEQVLSFFREHYPDAVPLMPTLVDDYLRNPTSSLVTVRCWPWVYASPGGKAVALAGDAAHAIVPFFGQGINAGFEDVRIMAECLERHATRGENWMHAALDEYQRLRKPNADAIARMAVDNFVEMRDRVGSRWFLWRKKLEHLLHDLFPETLVPRYNLVSFTIVPYSEAIRRGARIDRVLRWLLVCVVMMLVFAARAVLPAWLVLLAVVIAAGAMWDRWRTREDTSV